MKFRIVSDLHLEFNDERFYLPIAYDDAETTLILAGDIFPYKRFSRFSWFIKDVASRFKHVIWVFGNHEYYDGGSLIAGVDRVREYLKELNIQNITILDNDVLWIENTVILGFTLWTDMDRRNPVAMESVRFGMNDYNQIRTGTIQVPYIRKATPEDTIREHELSVGFMGNAFDRLGDIPKDVKVMVISHHAPCLMSVPEHFKNHPLNPAYYANLFETIYDLNKIDLWVHGHIHSKNDYQINKTRVISNPRGYISDGYPPENPDFDPNLIIEL